ncbi:MAG: hypothetical protein AAFQ71_14220, partial [Planctomycetota bacterium]
MLKIIGISAEGFAVPFFGSARVSRGGRLAEPTAGPIVKRLSLLFPAITPVCAKICAWASVALGGRVVTGYARPGPRMWPNAHPLSCDTESPMSRSLWLVALAGSLTSAADAQAIWTRGGNTDFWETAANWSTGAVPDGTGVNVLIDQDLVNQTLAVLQSARAVGGLSISPGDALTLSQGSSLSVNGGMDNRGTTNIVSIASTSATTDLIFVGSQAIVGDGDLILSDDPHNRIVANGAVLTNGALHTIRGAGQLLV